jgi:predicted P-loop ATPase
MPTLLEQLQELPPSWGLVAVDGCKRPYQEKWQANPLTHEQAAAEIKAGRAKAIGVIAGPPSGGLLFLDHDGISATEQLEKLGVPGRSLPKTATCTSGRDGRFQLLFTVPERYWPRMRNRRVFDTGKTDADGKAENLDLRWHRHQSVVIGAHPITGGYRWLGKRSPAMVGIAEAPEALINLLIDEPEPATLPLLNAVPAPSIGTTLPLLDFITLDSRQLIESGGTPGLWNDDQLKLALDLQGTEDWICAQGYHPDVSAADAFEWHISAASSKAKDFDARKARHRFDGAAAHNPKPGTPLEKLESRLAFHTRTQRRVLASPPAVTPTPAPAPAPEPKAAPPSFTKPTKLEAGELLFKLRTEAGADRLRYNRFSQQIEMDGQVLEGAERFYLKLAEEGHKVGKELAIDCLIQVAHENPYDPVALYLDHVAATVEPAYIGGLATAYLRPEDAATGAGETIYDHMMRCTLIGAVKRVFQPGCKHDTATVLMGDQGARKSSFWSALGGAFFSDALGDISSKDDLMVLHRSWIMEWAELDHIMGRKHAGQIKSFLSQSTDLFRVPYGKATEAFPRRGIIVGSTNRSTGFLSDDTGNRRFWVIPTTCTESNPIDTPQLMVERDAIWSAAVHAYRAKEPNYLPTDLAAKVTQENESYLIDSPWLPAVQEWLAKLTLGDTITTERILSQAVQKPIERQTRADQMAVADILRSLTYRRERVTIQGSKIWRWVKAC